MTSGPQHTPGAWWVLGPFTSQLALHWPGCGVITEQILGQVVQMPSSVWSRPPLGQAPSPQFPALEYKKAGLKFPRSLFFFFFFFNFIATLFIYLFIYFWLCWVFGSCEGFL